MDLPASKTLIPLNAAVLIGGMATTIGTSTNVLVVSIAGELGMPHMSVFHFTPIVAVAALAALPYLWLVAPRMLGDNSVAEIAAQRRFRTRLRVTEGSMLNGRALAEILPRLPVDIEFHDAPLGLLKPMQRLAVSATHETLEEAIRMLKGEAAPGWVLDRIRNQAQSNKEDVLAVEMTVTADSRLLNRTSANLRHCRPLRRRGDRHPPPAARRRGPRGNQRQWGFADRRGRRAAGDGDRSPISPLSRAGTACFGSRARANFRAARRRCLRLRSWPEVSAWLQ